MAALTVSEMSAQLKSAEGELASLKAAGVELERLASEVEDLARRIGALSSEATHFSETVRRAKEASRSTFGLIQAVVDRHKLGKGGEEVRAQGLLRMIEGLQRSVAVMERDNSGLKERVAEEVALAEAAEAQILELQALVGEKEALLAKKRSLDGGVSRSVSASACVPTA